MFLLLDNSISAAIVGGFFAVLASTITVMIARYYEEKQKQAELYREKKVEMYEEFISRLFEIFTGEKVKEKLKKSRGKSDEEDLAVFLRRKQTQFLLWSNADFLRAFSEWQKDLAQTPDANTLFKTESMFLAIRKDLGHSNWGMKKGDTIRNLLNETDLLLETVKKNPKITLDELSKLSKELEIEENKSES